MNFWNIWSEDPKVNQAKWIRSAVPSLAPVGNTWRRAATANPDILQQKKRTLLYFRGTGATSPGEGDRDSIGLVEIVNPETMEVKDLNRGHPCVRPGGPRDWDADVLDPAAIVFNDQVLLYYSALGAEGDYIGLVRSQDGVEFGRGNQIMPGRAPEVIVRSHRVWLFNQMKLESGGYGVYLLASLNGRDFTSAARGPVLGPSTEGWDSFSVVTMRVWEENGTYYTLYGGSSSKLDEPEGFGLARSTDLLKWERHPGNPIMVPAEDEATFWFPALLKTPTGWTMLYEGGFAAQGKDLQGRICRATVAE